MNKERYIMKKNNIITLLKLIGVCIFSVGVSIVANIIHRKTVDVLTDATVEIMSRKEKKRKED